MALTQLRNGLIRRERAATRGTTSTRRTASHINMKPASPGIIEGRDYFSDTPLPGYTPYTYPHPLTGGGGTSPTPTPAPSGHTNSHANAESHAATVAHSNSNTRSDVNADADSHAEATAWLWEAPQATLG